MQVCNLPVAILRITNCILGNRKILVIFKPNSILVLKSCDETQTLNNISDAKVQIIKEIHVRIVQRSVSLVYHVLH